MDLEQFYDEHVGKVYKFFYIKSLNRMVAEDLTADTFVAFMEQIETRVIDDYKKYLYGIMRNIWVAFLREKYNQALVDIETIDNFDAHVEYHLEQFDATPDLSARLASYIDKLPEKQRLVLTLRLIHNKSVGSVARELGRDKNYVKTTHHRALKTLRSLLSQPYMEETL